MPKGSRKYKELDHTRHDILRAAARAAARAGFDAVTIRDIAAEAGYTASTLYTYFDGKEAIVEGLLHEISDLAAATVRAPLPDGLTFRQKLELLAQRQLTVIEEWRDGILALLPVMWGSPTLPFGINIPASIHEGVVRWLRANAGPDDLGGRDRQEVARFYYGVMLAVVPAVVDQKIQTPLVSLLPRVMSLLFHGLGSQK